MELSFERWLPEGAKPCFYDVQDVRFSDGVQVLLVAKDHAPLLLRWERYVCCHVSDEAYREDCWVSDPKDAWSFFVSEDSALLQAYRTGSCLPPEATRHYLLVGSDSVVDLLSHLLSPTIV